VTPSQLAMLRRNNLAAPDSVRAAFGFAPMRFSESSAYLRDHGGRMHR